jgi:hypothetical protein
VILGLEEPMTQTIPPVTPQSIADAKADAAKQRDELKRQFPGIDFDEDGRMQLPLPAGEAEGEERA